jgi:hypothetical protein
LLKQRNNHEMTQVVQCPTCGAVLADEDIFCGECGTPHPGLDPNAEPPPAKPAPSPPSRPQPARPARSTKANWQIVAIVMAGLGAILCLVGLILFAIFGMTSTEGYTTAENWLISAMCCLLPIAGSGALLALTSIAIWLTRLKDR